REASTSPTPTPSTTPSTNSTPNNSPTNYCHKPATPQRTRSTGLDDSSYSTAWPNIAPTFISGRLEVAASLTDTYWDSAVASSRAFAVQTGGADRRLPHRRSTVPHRETALRSPEPLC